MKSHAFLPRLEEDRRLIDRWLSAALRETAGVPRVLGAAMSYAALGPGKRIRPILCLEAYRAARRARGTAGQERREVGPFCCGIELVHAFSLAHDDLPSMDDDDFRRGRPSLHRKYDEATAILAGDALFARAYELFARSAAPAGRTVSAVRLLAHAVGPAGMAGGQVLDLAAGQGAGRRAVARLQEKKTAMFIAAALAAGTIIGGAGPDRVKAVWQAGIDLGRLFQVTDDLLDAGGQDRGKETALSVAGRAGAEGEALRLAARARRRLLGLGQRYELLAAVPAVVLARKK